LSKTFTGRNWDYQAFRNCAIEGYMPAAEEMTKRGHYVIRMGSIVGDLMNTENPKIIEYAHKGFRTELLDIYLSANCYFIITCSSGLDGVTWFFKRPGVIVNFVHLEHINSWQSNHITIFKKYWLKRENRFMSIQEILESGAGRFLRSELYEDMGIELIDNTPEEIMDVVDEMDKRLKGTWQTSEADEELQRRFWFFFKSSSLHGVIRSRVGTEFLRQNRELLY
jgi:putative glycosyltransferase (TIGR04372 family)